MFAIPTGIRLSCMANEQPLNTALKPAAPPELNGPPVFELATPGVWEVY